MLLENTRVDDHFTPEQISTIQPREYEGCFAEVNENGAINIYLIQDQIPEWLLAFLDNDLNLAYLNIEGLPVISMRFRHLQLTMPVYNKVPSSNILTLCSLDYPQMRVNKIKRYALPEPLFEQIKEDVAQLDVRTPSIVYARADAFDENETNFTIFEHGSRATLEALR